jgi:hypothetical protein
MQDMCESHVRDIVTGGAEVDGEFALNPTLYDPFYNPVNYSALNQRHSSQYMLPSALSECPVLCFQSLPLIILRAYTHTTTTLRRT